MVVTRIAPSPTGDPHVGTAYVAIFNYIWARKNGGIFIVRIEDTDQSRYKEGSEERILDMLHWIDLDYQQGPDVGGPYGPYRQSKRLEIYRRHAEVLVEAGQAYRAFETPAELAAIREELVHTGRTRGYDNRARNIPPTEAKARAEAGEPHVIRLMGPDQGQVVVQDGLRGQVSYSHDELPDAVLLKSDGYPTYHLANVVDDHLMKVSDVIRAEEWLVSTPIHVLLYQALGWPVPNWYHLPLLRNPDKTKISKRKSHTSVDHYRERGILPEALRNYLSLMGFSMPDGSEVFNMEEMADAFSWDRVSLGGPIFDERKLVWLSGKYIREVLSLDELAEHAKPFVVNAGFAEPELGYLKKVLELMRVRFETLEEFAKKSTYFFEDSYPFQEKALRKIAEERVHLSALRNRLAALRTMNTEITEPLLRGYAEEAGVKPGKVMQPLRAALTGTLESPGMFELLQVLGKERVLNRLDKALAE